jgi:hypothetical protein
MRALWAILFSKTWHASKIKYGMQLSIFLDRTDVRVTSRLDIISWAQRWRLAKQTRKYSFIYSVIADNREEWSTLRPQEGCCYTAKPYGKSQIARLLRFRCSSKPNLSVIYLLISMLSIVKQKFESYALATARIRTHTDATNPYSNESSEVDIQASGSK